jgi:hypothetical protein
VAEKPDVNGYQTSIIALADHMDDRHHLLRIFPGANRRMTSYRIKHCHDIQQFDLMMQDDPPHYLFLGGWLQAYHDWKQLCDILINGECWPRLVLLTTIDVKRAEEMMEYTRKHAPNMIMVWSPWGDNDGYGLERIKDRYYHYEEDCF